MDYNLFERLKGGETPESIAEEFTAQLNAALAEQQKEADLAPKYNRADEVLIAVQDFLTQYYPGALGFFDFTPEEFCELCSSLETMNDKFDILGDLFKDLFK